MKLTLASLLFFALLPLTGCAQSSSAPEAGVDYHIIDQGQAWQPTKGKIEVVEVFGYWCPHCADFQPLVDAWKKTLPADVQFTYVPSAFSLEDPYARAYFAAEAARALPKTHNALFDAIHKEQSLPKRGATIDELGVFFSDKGYPQTTMTRSMQSPAVDAKMKRAYEFAIANRVQYTPTLIINGKYRIEGGELEDKLRTANALIAKERANKR
jgi:protein dithiol oxidoreductase (disulfide-forming)